MSNMLNLGSPGDTHVEIPGKQSETQCNVAIHRVCRGRRGTAEEPSSRKIKRQARRRKENRDRDREGQYQTRSSTRNTSLQRQKAKEYFQKQKGVNAKCHCEAKKGGHWSSKPSGKYSFGGTMHLLFSLLRVFFPDSYMTRFLSAPSDLYLKVLFIGREPVTLSKRINSSILK